MTFVEMGKTRRVTSWLIGSRGGDVTPPPRSQQPLVGRSCDLFFPRKHGRFTPETYYLGKKWNIFDFGGPRKKFSKKFSEKSIFSTFGDAVFQNLHFEYASYGIKRCAEQFPTHNTMFLSYWVAKMCVQKLFASTFHRQCLGVFSEFFWSFSDHIYTPQSTFHCTFLPLEIS